MRDIETRRELAAEKGLKARARIREVLHPATIATSVRARLEELGLLRHAMPAGAHYSNR